MTQTPGLGVLAPAIALLTITTVSRDATGQGLIETLPNGSIDWSKKIIRIVGHGIPRRDVLNAAIARDEAERQARSQARDKLLESLQGLRIHGTVSLGERMEASEPFRVNILDIINKFNVESTKYYSDNGVDVVASLGLDGPLLSAVVAQPVATSERSAGEPVVTGIVVLAAGMAFKKALAPEIYDEHGKRIFHAGLVTANARSRHGVVGYAIDVQQALEDGRVGSRPALIRALGTKEPDGSDLIVSADDAMRLLEASRAMTAGRVIVVVSR